MPLTAQLQPATSGAWRCWWTQDTADDETEHVAYLSWCPTLSGSGSWLTMTLIKVCFKHGFSLLNLQYKDSHPGGAFLVSSRPWQHPKNKLESTSGEERVGNNPPQTDMKIPSSEILFPGTEAKRIDWKTVNRPRTKTGRSKTAWAPWGYKTGPIICECREADHTMDYCL